MHRDAVGIYLIESRVLSLLSGTKSFGRPSTTDPMQNHMVPTAVPRIIRRVLVYPALLSAISQYFCPEMMAETHF